MTAPLRERFESTLGFALDDFQHRSLDAVDAGRSVLVSAPTGSGKTLVATYAIERQQSLGQRSFYTTPLKALSNQKYHELCGRFGLGQVGLLTGDVSIERDAPIVVMTTEVLRNMLLTESRQVERLGLVVLDEVHYLQDPFRGGVWEEVIVLTPASVQFVALSATVSNAPFVGEWLSSVRGPTDVVVESTRPIRLHNHVALQRRAEERPELLDLLDDGRLADAARRVDNQQRATRKFRPGPKWHGSKSSAPPPPFRAPRRSDLLRSLDGDDLLPAIVFIFSRAACDDAVSQVTRDGLLFSSPEQRRQIRELATARVSGISADDLKALEFHTFSDSLERGIAAHHAGMVPAFREIVEQCFERGWLGVVFATETLALGVNMPARSVVIERFTKQSDLGRRLLTSGDFAQLTGRAGRRGLDDEGHAVVCFQNGTSMLDIARIATSPAPELHSSFRPTYNLTTNLIYQFDAKTAEEILCRSYAQFEADRRVSKSRRSLVDQFAMRRGVLDELGYIDGWRLTDAGHVLRSLYHECDLVVAETIRSGVLEDAEPSTLAAIVSLFVYEARRPARPGPHRHTPTKAKRVRNDRLGEGRRADIAERASVVHATYAFVSEVESRHDVRTSREPDAGLAPVVAAWARGATLHATLDLADVSVGLTSPGDFVRHVKQVGDLCEQIGRLTHLGSVAATAREATDLVLRSVVAGASVIPPFDEVDT